jgi:hypothetical protein
MQDLKIAALTGVWITIKYFSLILFPGQLFTFDHSIPGEACMMMKT